MLPYFSKPVFTLNKQTHITDTYSTCIDHILTNNCSLDITAGLLETSVTDHLPVFVLIEQRNQHIHKNEHFKRTLKNFDSTSFCKDLYICLESYFIIQKNESELDIMFTNILNDIRNKIDRHAHLQKLSKRKAN